MFKCDKCGKCCENLQESELYSDLDRGDGICKHLDVKKHLCRIYENRPLKCNVDKMYKLYFSDKMTLDEYYSLNNTACTLLKNKF